MAPCPTLSVNIGRNKKYLEVNFLCILKDAVRSPDVFDPPHVQDPVVVRLLEGGQAQSVVSPGESQEHVGGEGHLVLIEGIQHEDRHVEEHNGRLVAEQGRNRLVVGLVAGIRHDVLQPENFLEAATARG